MFSAVERTGIFRIIAGVLHLGNIVFDVDASGDYVTGVSGAAHFGARSHRVALSRACAMPSSPPPPPFPIF